MPDTLTLEDAQRIVEVALAESNRRGAKTAVAVVDGHGDLILVARLDGARDYYPDVAYGKAMSAALFEDLSRNAGRLVDDANPAQRRVLSSIQQRVNQLNGDSVVYAPGAVPLRRGDLVIGAVGVGGSGGDSDEEIATLAARVLDE